MNVDRVLTEILGSNAGSGFAGGLAGGLASGLLTSKAGRKLGKKALQVGGLAAVAGVAYAAWQRYRHDRVEAKSIDNDAGLILLRAMIAAGQADGKLDGVERRAILDRVLAMNLPPADRAELIAELEHPVDVQVLVAAATTPELALEIYTASRLAIDADTSAERAYLSFIAARLGLHDELVTAVNAEATAFEEGAPEPALPAATTGKRAPATPSLELVPREQ